MGSASSKFKKYLVHGDEFAAMQVFQGSPELRRNLDPNLSYGESHTHNTPLHYAAKHAMKHLLRTFLNDLGGNPNKKNAHNETALHLACRLGQQKGGGFGAQERRAACVALLLQWRGPPVTAQPSAANTTTATQPQTPQSAQPTQQQQSVQPNSQQQQQQPATPATRERVQINARDQEGNTALHMAAGTGLRRCVELLLSAPGCELFIENFDKLTPCDLAMRNQHHDIARLLEARMVFADNSDLVNEDELNGGQGEQEEVYSGLRTQDLQEAKDQLLVETSDMLHIPLFTAEALLRDNEWSREALLEKWMKDPVQCCQMAGVQAPASALHHFGSIELCSPTNRSIDSSGSDSESKSDILCEICYTCTVPSHPQLAMSCKHNFCTSCWERYLNEKISAGDAHHILCPAYQCHILVPAELIERLVSPDMARRYLQFDIKAFVETNRSIKWCPMAGCGRAVRLPECEQTPPPGPESEALITPRPPPTSHAVDCGNSHFFCWECLGEAHAPCGCEQWAQWQHKIAQVKPEELRASCDESEAAANCLWLVTNSKPCPNCKSPIQKNEGCNHMKCSKCKFDFCWVCQESWKRHSSATGGYFRCNRWEAAAAADARRGEAAAAAATRSAHVEHVTRFVHYYTRFRNHENSRALEQPLLTAARRKMELLRGELERTGQSEDCGEKGTKFIEDGVRELLKARRILCGSYVYGYYLEDNGYNKTIFEFMQNELEEVTEKLSEMIARPYLRTPKSVIVQTTALARRKRHEFVRAVAKGLVPPETPPSMRTVKRRKLNDIQMHQLRQIDPSNPWVKEAQDRLYEWPEYESDEEAEVNKALAVSILGECTRNGCTRPRARNIQTGAILDYCSLRCSKTANGSSATELSSDYNMELVIALEMSRLQMIEDRMRQVTDIGHGLASVLERLGGSQSSTDPPGTSQPNQNSGTNDILDDQLKLAIQLSLQESTAALSKQLLQQEQQKLLQQQSQQSIDLVSTSTQAPEQSSSESPINNDTKPKTIKLTKATITGSSIDDTAPCGQLRINYDDSTILKSSGDINKSGLIDENDMSCNRGQDLQTSTMNKTVDYFLKSLANQKIDLRRNIEETMQHRDCNLPTELKNNDNKDASAYYKTSGISTGQRKEDGRFQIGDIHETGYIQFVTPDDINDDIFLEGDERLKRSHSTGDLVIRRSGRGSRIRLGLAGTVVQAGNEPRYHLDSDHSSNHDEKCEEVARRLLALPSATIRARQFLLLQHQNHYNSNISSAANMDANTPGGISNDTPTSEETTDVKLAPEFYFSNHKVSPLEDQNVFYQGQSSVEDTTTSDSLNEMCGSSLIQDDELNSKEILEEKFVYAPIVNQDEYSLGSFKLRTYKKSPKLLRNNRNRRSNSAVEEENELFESSKCKHSEIEDNVEPKLESSVITMSNSYIVKTEHIQEPSSSKMNPLACLKAKLCSAHLPKTSYLTKMAVHKSIGLLSHTDMNASTSCNSTNVKQKQKSGMSQYGTKIFSKSTEKISTKTETSQNLLESHRKAFKLSGGKTKSQNLRIRICKSPPPIENSEVAKITSQSDPASNKPENVSKFRALETDSSNEYESETGIPKSPTLYISGVSISRTPEPKSPGLNFVMVDSNGRQSRSSSLTVPTPANNNSLSPSALNTNTELTVSSSSLNVPGSPEPYTPSMIRSMTPQTSFTNLRELVTVQGLSPQRSPVLSSTASGKENSRPLHRPPRSTGSTPCRTRSGTSSCSNEGSGRRQHHDSTTSTSTTKSKSASEPEREREMFRFPKSSTDGALSSVLHVQESNLSSDDFHEALFLLERSPKTPRDSKRRRKVKKKDKESIGDCGRKEEASSVL